GPAAGPPGAPSLPPAPHTHPLRPAARARDRRLHAAARLRRRRRSPIDSLAIAAAAWLGASGCVTSHPDYPASWSPLLEGAACSVLSGTYEDRGVEGQTGAGVFRGHVVSLSR